MAQIDFIFRKLHLTFVSTVIIQHLFPCAKISMIPNSFGIDYTRVEILTQIPVEKYEIFQRNV